MSNTNDITGDVIQTKVTTDSYRDGWDKIFGSKDEVDKQEEEASQEKVNNVVETSLKIGG